MRIHRLVPHIQGVSSMPSLKPLVRLHVCPSHHPFATIRRRAVDVPPLCQGRPFGVGPRRTVGSFPPKGGNFERRIRRVGREFGAFLQQGKKQGDWMRFLGRRENRPGKTSSSPVVTSPSFEGKENLDDEFLKSIQKLSKSELRRRCGVMHEENLRQKERLRQRQEECTRLVERDSMNLALVQDLKAKNESLQLELMQRDVDLNDLRQRESDLSRNLNAEVTARNKIVETLEEQKQQLSKFRADHEESLRCLRLAHEKELEDVQVELNDLTKSLSLMKEYEPASDIVECQSTLQKDHGNGTGIEKGLQEFLDDVSLRDQDITFLFGEIQSLREEIKRVGHDMEEKDGEASRRVQAAELKAKQAMEDLEWEEKELHRMQSLLVQLESKIEECSRSAQLQEETHSIEMQKLIEELQVKEAAYLEVSAYLESNSAALEEAGTHAMRLEKTISEQEEAIRQRDIVVEESLAKVRSLQKSSILQAQEVADRSEQLRILQQSFATLEQKHASLLLHSNENEEKSKHQTKILEEKIRGLSEGIIAKDKELQSARKEACKERERMECTIAQCTKMSQEKIAERECTISSLVEERDQACKQIQEMQQVLLSDGDALKETMSTLESIFMDCGPVLRELPSIIDGYEANISIAYCERAYLESEKQQLVNRVASLSHELMLCSQQNISHFCSLEEERRTIELKYHEQEVYIDQLISEKEKLSLQIKKLHECLQNNSLSLERYREQCGKLWSPFSEFDSSKSNNTHTCNNRTTPQEIAAPNSGHLDKTLSCTPPDTEQAIPSDVLGSLLSIEVNEEGLSWENDTFHSRIYDDLWDKQVEFISKLEMYKKISAVDKQCIDQLKKRVQETDSRCTLLLQEKNDLHLSCAKLRCLFISKIGHGLLQNLTMSVQTQMWGAYRRSIGVANFSPVSTGPNVSTATNKSKRNGKVLDMNKQKQGSSGLQDEYLVRLVVKSAFKSAIIEELNAKYEQFRRKYEDEKSVLEKNLLDLSMLLRSKFIHMENAIQRSESMFRGLLLEAKGLRIEVANFKTEVAHKDAIISQLYEEKVASENNVRELTNSLETLVELQMLLDMAVHQTEENEIEFQKLQRTLEENPHFMCQATSDEETPLQ